MKSYMKAISVGNFALIRRSHNVPGQAHAGAAYGRDVIPVGIVKHQRADKKSE